MRRFFEKDIHLGILKGGQLGRMLLQPCMNYGVVPHIMDIDPHAPARPYCRHFTVGDALSFEDVYRFGKGLDAVTLEYEHVDLDALKKLEEEGVMVFPRPGLIEIIRDKGLQKQFYRRHGIPTPVFSLVSGRDEIPEAMGSSGAVQKKRLAGYDGKGVVVLDSKEDLSRAFDEPSVIEEKIDIEKEISVLIARNGSGQTATYPVIEMVFHPGAGMLDYLLSPARITPAQERRALRLAETLAEKLALVGMMAVEMFLSRDGGILVNEIAPRSHNSGHHTIEASTTSQFEQQVRAVFDLPLGSTAMCSPAAMVNIIGEPGHEGPVMYEGIRPLLELPGVYVHRYGKKVVRPYRKMGHITVVRPDPDEALAVVKRIKEEVKAISCSKAE